MKNTLRNKDLTQVSGAKTAERSPDESWFPLAVVCRMLRVSRQNFHGSWKRHVPPAAMRSGGKGRETLIDTRAFIDSLMQFSAEREREKFGDDALLVGGGDGSSPSLQRLRIARAKLAELDLAERRGELVHVQTMQQGVGALAGVIRDALVRARTMPGGNEIVDAIEEALDEFSNGVEKLFRDLAAGSDGNGNPKHEAEVTDAE